MKPFPALLILFLCLSAFEAKGQVDITIGITSALEETPPGSYPTIEVEVSNWTSRKEEGIASLEGTVSTALPFVVDAKETRKFNFLFPSAQHSFVTLRLGKRRQGQSTASYTMAPGPAVAYSPDFAWVKRDAEKSFEGNGKLSPLSTTLNFLPEDWRTYAGVNLLFLTKEDWEKTDATRRIALRQWVASGGNLIVEGTPDWSIFGPQQAEGAYGFGRFESREKVTGKDAIGIIHFLTVHPSGISIREGGDPSMPRPTPNPALSKEIEKISAKVSFAQRKPPQGLIVVVTLCFVALVGPINFFWLAPASQRARLFVTTPLIALGTSALLIGVILFQDGFNGVGARFTIHQLFPHRNETLVYQQQTSTCGLLLSSSFTLDEPVHLLQTYPDEHDSTRSHSFRVNGNRYSGRWFRSRKIQMQALTVARPSRAGLAIAEHAEGKPPIALSSIAATLDHLFYVDAQGDYWHASNVGTGQRVALAPSTRDALADALKAENHKIPASQKEMKRRFDQLVEFTAQRQHFFALSSQPEMIETHPAIDWQEDTGIYFGQVSDAPPAGKEPLP